MRKREREDRKIEDFSDIIAIVFKEVYCSPSQKLRVSQ